MALAHAFSSSILRSISDSAHRVVLVGCGRLTPCHRRNRQERPGVPAMLSASAPCRSKGQPTRAMSKISTHAAQGTHGKTELSGRPFALLTRWWGLSLMNPSCAGRLGTNRATTQKLSVSWWRLCRQWQQAPRRRLAPRSIQRQQAPAAAAMWGSQRQRRADRDSDLGPHSIDSCAEG